MTGSWRRDLLAAQQLGLPADVALILLVSGLSVLALPWPYGLIVCIVGLALVAAMLYQNARRRGRGVDGWRTRTILGPLVALPALGVIGTVVPGPLAAALVVAALVGGVTLLVRRLRRPAEPGRSTHHFRGVDSPNDEA